MQLHAVCVPLSNIMVRFVHQKSEVAKKCACGNGARPAADLVHPALAVLARYDAETHSELMRTLQVYLANERNHVRTAAELGLHRNSLAHRIRRIEALTGIDFDDVDERFFLELSLRLSTRA